MGLAPAKPILIDPEWFWFEFSYLKTLIVQKAALEASVGVVIVEERYVPVASHSE